MLQDRTGFMWFGTQDGLNRYDGYQFVVYRHDPSVLESLSSSSILSLLEDASGSIWIGTTKGLNRSLNGGASFSHLSLSTDGLEADELRIQVIADDPHSRSLWLGTSDSGVVRFDPLAGSVHHFRSDPSEPGALSDDRVRALLFDLDDELWVGTLGGLNRYSRKSDSFVQYRHDSGRATSLGDDRVRSLSRDASATLWVGTYSSLDRMVADGSFVHLVHDPDDPSSLGAGRVRALFADSEKRLWVGTDDGISLLRQSTESFFRYPHRSESATGLAADRVTSIYQDQGNVLWVGTQGGGVSRWNPNAWSFGHYRTDPDSATDLKSNAVLALSEGPDGRVWVGTLGGGLTAIDRSSGASERFAFDPRTPDSLSGDRVSALLHDREGRLWAGTMSNGLNRLDPGSSAFQRYRNNAENPESLSSNAVMSLFEDRRGALWIGTFGGGLNRMESESGSFRSFRHDPSAPESLGDDRVTAIAEEQGIDDGERPALWVGTYGGLSRLDPVRSSFRNFRHESAHRESLSSNALTSLYVDAHDVLWIGTEGRGLNKLPLTRWEEAEFEHFTEQSGLVNNVVYAIKPDREAYLWLSTVAGLSRFDPITEEFANFDVSHGLQSNEFNLGAAYASPHGELFFGGFNGFNAFNPSRVRQNRHLPPVVLTGFWKLDQRVLLEGPIHKMATARLSYRDILVSFEFAALDFTAPDRNRYAYKLEGFNTEWIDSGVQRRITFTNLDSGRYVLRVKGANNDGMWNESGSAIEILVEPPPWRTWWAYSGYAVVLAGLLAWIVRFQARKWAREAAYRTQLETEVELRTSELGDRNQDLERLNRELEQASLTDSLTGLRNRRYVIEHIGEYLALVDRFRFETYDLPIDSPHYNYFLLLILDLDGFKAINDNWGHAAGDRALLHVRDTVRQACRHSDTLIRWAGDEFLVIGHCGERAHGASLAERIRRQTSAQLFFPTQSSDPLMLTCSIGYSFYPFASSRAEALDWEQILAIADRALYAAKNSGRNGWVGLFSKNGEAGESFYPRLIENPGVLIEEQAVEVRTSYARRKLVWTQA